MDSGTKKRKRKDLLSSVSFNNDELHLSNFYKGKKIDFKELTELFPTTLGAHVIKRPDGHVTIDFTDPVTSYYLTQSLLCKDFGMKIINFPEFSTLFQNKPYHKLIPPLPNRLNYICWLNELFLIQGNMNTSVHIIDIGVGPHVIYPLLGNSLYQWKFTGSDIDEESIYYANQNILLNFSTDNCPIKIIQTNPSFDIQELILQYTTHSSQEILSNYYLNRIGNNLEVHEMLRTNENVSEFD